MIYYFQYSDGTRKEHYFSTERAASWFAYNEGDHLIRWGIKIH